MNEFAFYLGERRHSFYHYLYFAKPQAYTSEDCFKRIEANTKYQEVSDIIERLPLEQKKVADNRFEELKQTFSTL